MDATSVDWSFAASQAFLPPRTPLFANAGSGVPDNNSFFSTWHTSASANRRHHQRTPSTSFLPQTPAWVDDLLNDTPDLPPPKNLHRRSSSDSLALLETPLQHVRINDVAEEEELGSSSSWRLLPKGRKNIDKVDEERIMPKIIGNANANVRASSAENGVPFDTSSALSDRDSANASSLEDMRTKGVGQSKNETEVQSALKLEHSAGKGEVFSSADGSLDPKRAKR